MAKLTQDMLNPAITRIRPSLTLGIDAKAKAMIARGIAVCSFAAGEPDHDTPVHVKQAAIKALNEGKTKYAPVAGLDSLRTAIRDKLERDNGLKYDVGQIVISNGAKHSLYNVFMALLRPGDEVILPSPYWLSYPEMIQVAGGVCREVPCDEANDFKMTAAQFEAAITPRTKAVVINSPSNPVGCVYSRGELQAIAGVAVKKGIFIISDEIYEKMVYDGVEHVSIGSFSPEVFEQTITVNGFSKAYSMTGWRLGYAAGPVELMKAINAYQSHTTSGANTFAMFGGVDALLAAESQVPLAGMLKDFIERRAYLHGRLVAMKGVTCIKPGGAFYMLPNISRSGLKSVEFCDRLLEQEKVALVPGAAFAIDTHVRISYACSMENIRRGMDGMERFLARV